MHILVLSMVFWRLNQNPMMMILGQADSNLLNKTGILKGPNPENITFLFNNATYGVVSTTGSSGSGSSPAPPSNQPPPPQDSNSTQSSNSPPPPSPPPPSSSPPPSSPPPSSPPPSTSQSGASPANNSPPPPAPAWGSPPTTGQASSSSNQNGSSSGEGQTSPSSDKTSPPSPPPSASNEAIIGGVIAGSVIMFLVALLLVVSWRKKRKQGFEPTTHNLPLQPDGSNQHGEENKGQNRGFSGQSGSNNNYGISQQSSSMGSQRGSMMAGSRTAFSYEELMDITDSFSRQNMIGEGGFGCVYKGRLSDGRTVAIKQLKVGSGQGEREFQAEVDIISRVHHRHLVSLVGYCMAEHQRLLIYEFVPNNTLQHHLHGKDMPVLEWMKRLKIALGAAKGIAYLHEDCHPKIIHRDIKSANILIDDAFEAQVADFGLAKLTNDANTHVSTRVMGTFGYLAPEYATSGKLTDRSDVFSFGVVLLELVTGRKPVDTTQPVGEESLVEWARPLLLDALDTGDFSQLVDPRLGKNYVESEMFRMIEAAAACIRHSAPKRPRMARVVRALDCEGEESLSNGVKYGQSIVYNSEQYSEDIKRFQWSAISSSGGDSSSEYTNNSKHSWNRLLKSDKDSAEVTSTTF